MDLVHFCTKWTFHGEVDILILEVLDEENDLVDKMIDVIHDFIGLLNVNLVRNNVNGENDVAVGSIMPAQYYDDLFSKIKVDVSWMRYFSIFEVFS